MKSYKTIGLVISLIALMLFSGCSNKIQSPIRDNGFKDITICNLNGSDCNSYDKPKTYDNQTIRCLDKTIHNENVTTLYTCYRYE